VSVRARLARLEAALPDPPAVDEVVVVVRDGSDGKDMTVGDVLGDDACVTVRIVDASVLEPARVPDPELVARLRREVAASATTIH
jgi:hypothetical protein